MTSSFDRHYAKEEMEAAIAGVYYKFGKTKIDKTMRISLIKEIADLLNAEPGDEIQYTLIKGEICISKVTNTYRGYNIEEDLILENIFNYVKDNNLDGIECFDAKDDYDEIKKEYLERKKKN
jgi:hypothetical protein